VLDFKACPERPKSVVHPWIASQPLVLANNELKSMLA